MPDLTIPANTSYNLYDSPDFTSGDNIKIQNKSNLPIYLTSNSTAPSGITEGARLMPNEFAEITSPSDGAFVSAPILDALINAEVF